MKGNWKKIGIVGKAHGLRGAFFIGGRNNLLPNSYHDVVLGDNPGSGVKTKITKYQITNNRVLLMLAAVPDRTRVDFFAGQTLWADESTENIGAAAWLGREVVDCHGERLGEITEVFNYGASDTVQILAADQRTLELPLVDAYFLGAKKAPPSSKSAAPLALRVPSATFADLWE
jgi:16S rRNA processing protein RimM